MRRAIKAFTLVSAVFAGGVIAGMTTATSAAERATNPYRGLDTLARALTAIESHYIDEIDGDRVIYDAIDGMADGLDAHSVYMDPEAYSRFSDRTEGRFHGIGVELGQADTGAVVLSVAPKGPAALAGVQRGDLILRVDGNDAAGWQVADVAHLIEGPRGEAVQLDLLRKGQELSLSVVRDQVVIAAVTGELFAPGLAYVRIERFRQRVAEELEQELARLESEGGKPLDGIVLDLRDNPGGLLDEAVAVVDLFVGEGKIVFTRGRGGVQVESHDAHASADDLSAQLVVLVNGDSASASEIVAGSLKDLGRATLVGTPTYGKGSVQQIYEFEDGSALKLTVARYYLSDGEPIEDRVGIEPHIRVVLPSERTTAAARLRSELANRPDLVELVTALDADAKDEGTTVDFDSPLAERLHSDPQLEAAWRKVSAEP